jgi:hypothetical protein
MITNDIGLLKCGSSAAKMPNFSIRHRFSDWPNADVPAVAAGVYAVRDGDRLIYCGMSDSGLRRPWVTRRSSG